MVSDLATPTETWVFYFWNFCFYLSFNANIYRQNWNQVVEKAVKLPDDSKDVHFIKEINEAKANHKQQDIELVSLSLHFAVNWSHISDLLINFRKLTKQWIIYEVWRTGHVRFKGLKEEIALLKRTGLAELTNKKRNMEFGSSSSFPEKTKRRRKKRSSSGMSLTFWPPPQIRLITKFIKIIVEIWNQFNFNFVLNWMVGHQIFVLISTSFTNKFLMKKFYSSYSIA